jgi:hypothetical protein
MKQGWLLMHWLVTTQVHGHCEPGVRRSALLAAGQVLAALPAPRIAGALLVTRRSPSDAGLVDRLEWVKVSTRPPIHLMLCWHR